MFFATMCLLVATGCGGGGDIEQEPDSSQAEVFDKLKGIEAGVTLDPEGKIVSVDLDNSKHGDDSLAILKDIPTLTGVNLSGSSVTDAGLSQLYALQSLKSLNLEDTKITPAGANGLKEALPDCIIAYGSDVDRGGDGEDE